MTDSLAPTLAAVCLAILIAGCSDQKPQGLARSMDGTVEHIVFDRSYEVASPFSQQVFLEIPAVNYDSLNIESTYRSQNAAISDRKFSHIRLAVVRSFSSCVSLKEAAGKFNADILETSLRLHRPRHTRTGVALSRFYSISEEMSGLTSEPSLLVFPSPDYDHAATIQEADRCQSEFQALPPADLLKLRPVFVFWVYLEDDPSSNLLNDPYLARVTYIGPREYSFAGEFARMYTEGLAEDAVASVFDR